MKAGLYGAALQSNETLCGPQVFILPRPLSSSSFDV